jgi:hypothetical protein
MYSQQGRPKLLMHCEGSLDQYGCEFKTTCEGIRRAWEPTSSIFHESENSFHNACKETPMHVLWVRSACTGTRITGAVRAERGPVVVLSNNTGSITHNAEARNRALEIAKARTL